MRKQERVLVDAQPLPRRRAAGGDGAGLQGLSVTRPGFKDLGRDTDPGQRQLQAPLIANSAVLPRSIERLSRLYQSRPSPASTEIFGGSEHLQKFQDKPAERPHHWTLSCLHTRWGAEQHRESDPGAGRRVSPLRAINGEIPL